MDPNNEERRLMGLHLTLGVGNPDMGSYLRLGPPSPVADSNLDMGSYLRLGPPSPVADADADADDADGPPGNINPIRPYAPRFDSQGLYWCKECGNLTQGSQWRRDPDTGLRDTCNKHYQRKKYGERRNAARNPNRVVDA